jgi:hypothetical protein
VSLSLLSLLSFLSVLFFVPQPKNLDRHRRPRPGLSLTKDTDNKNKSKKETDGRTGRKKSFSCRFQWLPQQLYPRREMAAGSATAGHPIPLTM